MSDEELRKGLFVIFFVIFFLCIVNAFCGKLQQIRYYDQENDIVRIETENDIQQVPPKYQDIDFPPPYED